MFKKSFLFLISILGFLMFAQTASASYLYLSPGGGNIGVGSTLNVQIRLNTGGDTVNAVMAVLSYPENLLDITNIRPSSTFGIGAEQAVGGGSIRIGRGNMTGVKGDVLVATIGLKGKAAGSATLAFLNGSAAPRASDSSESLDLNASRGGVYNVALGASTGGPITSLPVAGTGDFTLFILVIGSVFVGLGTVGIALFR